MSAPSFPALYRGQVVHVRRRPRRHRLDYRVCAALLPIDRLDALANQCRLFSHNRFNLFSFFDRDHGAGAGPLRPWIEHHLARAGITLDGGEIWALCYPRMFGYVFNPLSTFFCYRADGGLAAVLYEVRNTFGEKHSYLIPVPAEDADAPLIRQACDKAFHVSPFIGMAARYRFRLAPPGARVTLTILESDVDGALLDAAFTGTRAKLTDGALIGVLLRYPLMTFKVIAGIHWEALKLWRKGARFHAKPPPPLAKVTIVQTGESG